MIGITKEESGGPCLTKFRRRIGHSLNLEAILLCRCRYVSIIPKVCWQNDFPVSRWYLTACLTRSLGGSKPFTMGATFLRAFFLAESIPSNTSIAFHAAKRILRPIRMICLLNLVSALPPDVQ